MKEGRKEGRQARKEGREGKEGRTKEGRKVRKEGRKEEGRREGRRKEEGRKGRNKMASICYRRKFYFGEAIKRTAASFAVELHHLNCKPCNSNTF
ncbi:hypothetical protein DPMN_023662 [Dreissena polymorpha]|uniref:Uncharacterized protein n=1 Tax=Dreissena polymorpha TaxID=45954 RepID=A0A9D4RAX9_DREPO|nr:hypothetical protein DPMN_023662 [Dreissena polymorpha]